MGAPPSGSDDHYFSEVPAAASRPSTVRYTEGGETVRLATDRGTFSPGRIDPGTAFLLASAPPPPPTGRFLDLGCGYGPLAIALARRSPAAEIVAVDVNERSRSLTVDNARQLALPNIEVFDPSTVPPGEFDLIWSNPPIRIGKAALRDLLVEWLGRLAPGGSAVLVMNRHLGADSMQKWLGEQGHPTDRLASKKGYRLLHSRRGEASDDQIEHTAHR